jgi:hypothetical protein
LKNYLCIKIKYEIIDEVRKYKTCNADLNKEYKINEISDCESFDYVFIDKNSKHNEMINKIKQGYFKKELAKEMYPRCKSYQSRFWQSTLPILKRIIKREKAFIKTI